VPGHLTRRRFLPAIVVLLAAAVPYLPTLDDYFVQDDFGVVSLLSQKPAAYFPRWFVSTWMDDIWGFTPDEIRPFPALSYQIAGIFGAGWPAPNHLINVAFHAVNALLVMQVAKRAAGLPAGAALFAAAVFAVLPMQTESVAWITGRVDSMPACFYLAAFLLYARWRADGRRPHYWWSVAMCFVALFTKQNAMTLAGALVLYDAIVPRIRLRLSWNWIRPYLPFVLLTLGYMWLRYALFGEVAREGTMTADRFESFLNDASAHVRRMIFGEPGLAMSGLRILTIVGAGVAAVIAVALRSSVRPVRLARPAFYFAVVWIVLAIAPTLVAGYASPRHMYLASAGWALALGFAFEVLRNGRPARWFQPAAGVLAVLVLAAYGLQLGAEVALWETRSTVSRQAVADLEQTARTAPPGALILAGAPRRRWEFALPFVLRPPFTSEDLTRRVSVISDSSLHCCPAFLWEEYTRETLKTWIANPARPPVILLYWDPETGRLSSRTDREDPFLRSLMTVFAETEDGAALDGAIHGTFGQLFGARQR
jgi:hypothetical protein